MKRIDDLELEYKFIHNVFNSKKMNFELNEKDEPFRNIYESITYLLSKVYIRADWHKIAKNINVRAEDVFQHKIKASGNMSDLRRFIDRLCNSLGLQSVEIITDVIDRLGKDEKKTLHIVRRESIYISRKAIELSNILIKKYTETKRKKSNEENKDEEQ